MATICSWRDLGVEGGLLAVRFFGRLRWTDNTPLVGDDGTRVASYLLGACVDFGLLGVMKAGARPILTFRITPKVASILAHDLHFRGLGDGHHHEYNKEVTDQASQALREFLKAVAQSKR